MIAPIRPMQPPFAPNMFLASETSIIHTATNKVQFMIGSKLAGTAHCEWKPGSVASVYGISAPLPSALIKLFSDQLPPKLKGEDNAIHSYALVEEFAGLLNAYHVALGNDHSPYLNALFALDRYRTSFWDYSDISYFCGMFPWMNAGINTQAANQHASSDVFLASDSAATYVEPQKWDEFLQGQGKMFGTSENPSVLTIKGSVESKSVTQPAFNMGYKLLGSQDDSRQELIRIDIFPDNTVIPIDEDLWSSVKSIAIERGGAFLHGIKWWIDNKPEIALCL